MFFYSSSESSHSTRKPMTLSWSISKQIRNYYSNNFHNILQLAADLTPNFSMRLTLLAFRVDCYEWQVRGPSRISASDRCFLVSSTIFRCRSRVSQCWSDCNQQRSHRYGEVSLSRRWRLPHRVRLLGRDGRQGAAEDCWQLETVQRCCEKIVSWWDVSVIRIDSAIQTNIMSIIWIPVDKESLPDSWTPAEYYLSAWVATVGRGSSKEMENETSGPDEDTQFFSTPWESHI